MPTIPISQIVKVNPGVLAAAGSAVDLNGLILTQSAYAPIGTVQAFSTAADVSAYFGPASTEYAMAQVYFAGYTNCTKTPGQLYFAQYPQSAVAGYLRGAKLTLTLAQLQALSGVLSVTVDGTLKTSTTINLSSATSFANAATIIAAGFTSLGAAVSYDAVRSAFVFTSSTTGATSSVSFASGSLSAGLALTSATGAVTSAGAVAAAPGTFMDALVLVTQNWALFTTTWEPILADKTAFSVWTNTQSPRFGYVGWDSDVNAKTAGSTNTWGAYLVANQSSGSVPIFGDQSHAAFLLGYAASLDFTRLNGRATAAFRNLSGLAASVSNATDATSLLANGYNFYGAYANAKQNFLFAYPGNVSGQWKWLDTYLNQIWLNANLQLAMVTLLTSVGSIPYNAQGYSLVASSCKDPIDAAVNFGAIRRGVSLSTSQVAQIQYAAGQDVSQTIYDKGYDLQIVPATAAVRAQRASPTMSLYYCDGGSIQSLTLASISIQ